MTETFSVRIAMTRKKSLRLVGSRSFTFSTANRGSLRVGSCASTIRTGKVQGQVSSGSYQTVVPQQNQIVFFPCSLLHEITPVECRSRAFADSRFTLNGWLHK